MSEQLKPCPFCGEAPGDVGYVFCMSKHDCPAVQIATTAEQWNRRAPIPPAEEIAAMRECIDARLAQFGRGPLANSMQYQEAISAEAEALKKIAGYEIVYDPTLAAARAKGGV